MSRPIGMAQIVREQLSCIVKPAELCEFFNNP